MLPSFRPGEREGDFLGNGPRTAVQPESALFPPLVGSFVKQRGQRKIRPSGSSPRCEVRPQEVFGHCTTLAIWSLPLASCIQVVPNWLPECSVVNMLPVVHYSCRESFLPLHREVETCWNMGVTQQICSFGRKARAIISCHNLGLYIATCLFASTVPVRFGLETARFSIFSTLVAQTTDDDHLD